MAVASASGMCFTARKKKTVDPSRNEDRRICSPGRVERKAERRLWPPRKSGSTAR
jgi:hypothetical protein